MGGIIIQSHEENEKQVWQLSAGTALRSELVATRFERDDKNFSDAAIRLVSGRKEIACARKTYHKNLLHPLRLLL